MTGDTLQTVAVDLTPILPGGENGGAKIFVLELLRVLAEMVPHTRFILLTQATSHEELSSLDSTNITRRMVMGSTVQLTMKSRLDRLAGRLLPHLPRRLRGIASGLGYRINSAIKRSGSSTLLGDLDVDLLFCPFTAPTFYEPGIPTVCTIYDLQYRTYPEFFTPEDVARRDRTFLEAARRATALAAISDYSRDAAIRCGNLDPERISTIYLRMARRLDGRADNAVIDRLGLVAQRYLVYPANFWKHKNHEMLLTAFGIACHGGLPADVKLVCTGAPGPRQQWLIRAAAAMNLGDRVLFPGYLADDEMSALLFLAAGMIFPSLYEGFGLPVVEAMAAGVPVGCSNVTSLPEVAAGAAILFDPRIPTEISSAVYRLVVDEAARTNLIVAGKTRAATFMDSARMAREYWDLFLSAVQRPVDSTLLSGVFPDGWCGGLVILHTPASDERRTLQMSCVVPPWLSAGRVSVRTLHGDGTRSSVAQLSRGEQSTVSIPLDPGVTRLALEVSPTFVPSHRGLGEDSRELSIMIESACIQNQSGLTETLYPEAREVESYSKPAEASSRS